MVASQAEPAPVASASARNTGASGKVARVRSSEPATAHSSSAPAPVASPSQLAQSVALTSGWRFSQAAFSSANAVQDASEAQAHRMPRQ